MSYTKIFSFLFLFITGESIMVHTELGDFPTAFWWFINLLLIVLFFIIKPQYYSKNDETPLLFVKFFLLWNIITILRGFFIADNYWEWKNLISTMFVFLIPLFVFLFINKDFLQKLLSFWFKYMIYLVLIFIPFINHGDFLGKWFSPLLLLILVLPILPYRWKIFTLALTFIIIVTSLDSRSNVLRLTMAFGLGSLYYFRAFFIEKIFKTIHLVLILLPVILLILGLSGIFNIFKMNDYIKGDYSVMTRDSGKLEKSSIKADTRTFLYVENITSAIKHDYILEGRTPANGYESKAFGDFLKWELGTGKGERFASEVSILNIFTWNGLIGVVLYFFIFWKSSYLAIYKSNNYFIKVIGLFVAFRWAYAFVEDFTTFDIQYIFLWALIAMCFSSSFRNMTDIEFKTWIRELLNNASLFKFKRY